MTISHAVLTGHQDPVRSVAFSYDSKLLATGGDDKSVILWLVTTHVSQWEFEAGNQRPDPPVRRSNLTGHQGRLRSVAFSPDRQLLATGSDDKDATLWGTRTHHPGTIGHPYRPQGPGVIGGLLPDGRLLATASADGTAILYHVRM